MAYRCSVPDIGNLRPWFNRHFLHICIEHDIAFETKRLPMIVADFIAAFKITIIKPWMLPILGVLYIIFFVYMRYRWHFWDVEKPQEHLYRLLGDAMFILSVLLASFA